MKSVQFTLPLNLDRDSAMQGNVTATYGETARRVTAPLYHDGKPYVPGEGTYVMFSCPRRVGYEILEGCALRGHVVEYAFSDQTTARIGTFPCQILIYDEDGSLLFSPSFTLTVRPAAYRAEAVTASQSFGALEALIAQFASDRDVLQEEHDAFRTAIETAQGQISRIFASIDDILQKLQSGGSGNTEEIMRYLTQLREYLSGMRMNWWSPRLAAALLSVCAAVMSLAACGAYVEGSGAESKYETLDGAVTELQTILGDVTEVGEVPTVPESSGGGTDEPTDPEGIVLSSITVSGMPEYAASGTVLSTLRASLTVTAVFSDGSRVVTEGYSLSCDSGVSLGERFEFRPGSHTVRVYLTVGDVTKSVSYTVSVAILSLTLNEETVSVYALPYTNGGITISGTFDGQSGTVTVAAVSGYRLSNCTINGVSRTTHEVQDEAVTVVAGTVRQYAVTLNLTHAEAYTDASMNLAFTSPHYVDAGSQVSIFLIAAGGYTLDENGIMSSGLYDVSIVSGGGGFLVSGYVTSGNVTVTAVARDPVMQTASLSIVSAPTDGSYSAVLYEQTESGTDGNVVDDWSAIPAGASYRLAVSAQDGYKVTSGTVLTCNGAVVTPYTTTQGIVYVYRFTPSAGDVYALTVATEANGSGGGEGGDSGETESENYTLTFLTPNSDGTAQTSATGVETFGDGQTYTTVSETIKTNKAALISEKITYKPSKVYTITVKPVTSSCRFQLAYFDASDNLTGYSTWDFGDVGTTESVFTLSGTTLSRDKGGTVNTETQTPGDATSFAIYCRTKANLVTYPDRLTVTMSVTDA